jgi:hypothetical protein
MAAAKLLARYGAMVGALRFATADTPLRGTRPGFRTAVAQTLF